MTRWAKFVVSRKWWVLILTVLAVVISGLWGLGVFSKLSQGGYIDPNSEAAQVSSLVNEKFGPQSPDIVAIYTAPEGKTLADIGSEVEQNLAAFRDQVPTLGTASYWSVDPNTAKLMTSNDGTKALATISIDWDAGAEFTELDKMTAALTPPGIDTEFAGGTVVGYSFNVHLQQDLVRAEAIALPITLLLLVVVFGTVTAAAVPVFVGMLAVLSALAILRLLTTVTEVSSFSINVASLLGLGLAIDYGLFIVSRFREELASGTDPGAAVRRTVDTAGRTVMFSGLLLVCAFAGMLVFPQAVIRSLGFGAIAAVTGAAVLSLTAVPALLAVLGHRINSLAWRRGTVERGEERARKFWGGVVTKVMRRPATVAVTITAGLLLLAAPLFGASLGEVTYTALPPNDPARTAADTLSTEFPTTGEAATVMVRGENGAPPTTAQLSEVGAQVRAVDGVAAARMVAAADDFAVLSATYAEGATPGQVVRDVRAIPAPAGVDVLVGGGAALVDDGNAAVTAKLPLMLAIMVGSTLVLLFLAFGSVVLPIKAVAMAGLSMAATFGVLTWIFQNGHGAELLDVTPAPLEATFVVLILAVVFGLSTDYEVFLMSRMVEARANGATTEEAVRFGAERTGRIVTTAAALLIIVTGAFTISGLSIMRFLGVGMILALIIDATVVRMLLVPSLVKLMGEANWWAPAWMRKLHEKVGIGH
ncbi:MMPL family transporter [Rhodococcus oryzae]|uniref:MMPL family transporter n=1 Tax=Rhodococcus oryzae TaxID=2571143 RepID=A0ABY2RRC4_9NOCA|nr:MMPL family transporter [Rhodococcus oryzae]TJZ81617.1 MMPL family transporter [Rhodococcus oryzae]